MSEEQVVVTAKGHQIEVRSTTASSNGVRRAYSADVDAGLCFPVIEICFFIPFFARVCVVERCVSPASTESHRRECYRCPARSDREM